jgi:hypothetical protein
MKPRPSDKHELAAISVKIKSDAELKPGLETNPDENSTVQSIDCSEAVDKFAELGDMEAGYERFGVAGVTEPEVEAEHKVLDVVAMNPSPSGNHDLQIYIEMTCTVPNEMVLPSKLKNPVKTKTDVMVEKPDHESFSDRDKEVCYERSGIEEITEISKAEVGTSTSDEDEGQSDWSLEECQALLGEAMTEKTRFHGSKLPPNATEDITENEVTKEPVVDICTRGTTTFGDPLMKDPVERVGQESWTEMNPRIENFAGKYYKCLRIANRIIKDEDESGERKMTMLMSIMIQSR